MEKVTVTKSIVFTACFLLVFAVSIAFVSGSIPEKASNAKFPQKLNQRMVLSVTNAKELEHVVDYASDGLTKISERIEYVDGTTTLIQYQGSQFAQKLIEFYPRATDSTKRQVKSEIIFKSGSSDFQSHTAFRPDGTKVKLGYRQEDGTYKTFTFFEDGKTVEKMQISTSDQFVLSESVWRKDGSTVKMITTDKNRNVFVWNYRLDNTLWMMYQVSTKGWSMPNGRFYDLDGKRVKLEFWLYSGRTHLIYRNGAQQAQFQVSFNKEEGEKVILVLNPSNYKPLYEQRWKHVSGKFDCTGKFSFVQVEEFKPESDYSNRQVERRIFASDLSETTVDFRLIQEPAMECLTLPEIKTN